MFLPLCLQKAIEEELMCFRAQDVIQAQKELSCAYRLHSEKIASKPAAFSPFLISRNLMRAAYVAARMPATFAAIAYCLSEICARAPFLSPQSLLDVGAGPGTSLWAALEVFPRLQKISLVEKDEAMMVLGKKFLTKTHHPSLEWLSLDLEKSPSFTSHDLVVCSYSLGELSAEAREEVVERAFAAAGQILLIIEPGTPAGFQRIVQMRDWLIRLGAHLVAPCPHALPCPLQGRDWCHFSARVERSALHRKVKEASLGYEDEKFSYLIVSKEPISLAASRVVRHPVKRSGHVRLTLCTSLGIEERVVSKKHGDLYKKARSIEWGDAF